MVNQSIPIAPVLEAENLLRNTSYVDIDPKKSLFLLQLSLLIQNRTFRDSNARTIRPALSANSITMGSLKLLKNTSGGLFRMMDHIGDADTFIGIAGQREAR